MSVKLSEFSEPRLLADREPKEPRDEPDDTDNVLREWLKRESESHERMGQTTG